MIGPWMGVGPQPPATERHQATPSTRRRLLVVAAAFALVHAMYLYSVIALQKDLLQADQLVWLREVLIPLDRGEVSLWQAITWDYTVLNHGHVPTLATLVVSERWFGLSLWLDVIVGYVSLAAMVWLHRAYIVKERIQHPRIVLLALTAVLFTAAPPPHWSLLQFQMLYIAQGVLLASVFASSIKSGNVRPVLIVIPVLMLLGGPPVAATIVAIAFISCLLAVRHVVSWSHPVGILATTAIAALTLHTLANGPRGHTTTTLDDLWTDGPSIVVGFIRSLGFSLGYLAPFEGVHPVVGAIVRVIVAAVMIGLVAATFRVWVRSLEAADCYPIALILSGLIWSAGVAVSRVPQFGTGTMLAPKYAPYLAGTIGIGMVLFWSRRGLRIHAPRWTTPHRLILLLAVAHIAFSMLSVGVRLGHAEARLTARVADVRACAAGDPSDVVASNRTCRFGDCPELVEYLVINQLSVFRR